MSVAPVSIQLYTLREAAASDFAGVIERLGRIGYVGVEPAGLHDLSACELRRRVEDAGMRISAAHVQLPLGDAANQILDTQDELGNRDLVVAYAPPERFADAGSVRQTADELNRANEAVRARGMTLGYHNHWWEFSSHIGGQTAHARLFGLLEPSVFAEVDTYWAAVGGADAAAVVAELGPRARMLHVKDGPADDEKALNTAVGEGVMDFAAITGANADAEWHVVELDRCATDMFEAVERSYAYLVESGLSRGRV